MLPTNNSSPSTSESSVPRFPPVGRQLKYKQIELEIRKLTETLPIGAKMPTERQLAISYDCSVLTIRKGMQVLADEGLINRRMGSGTFIARRSEKPVPTNRMLGVLVHQQSDRYAYRLLQAVAHAALQQSIQPRSVWINGFDHHAQTQLDGLRREGCTAFIIPWFPLELSDEVQAFLRTAGVPISLPQLVPGFESYCFEVAQVFGRRTEKFTDLLCHYFSLLGVANIAFLGPDVPHNPVLNQQLLTYTSAISRRQQQVICRLVPESASAMDVLAKQWADHRGNLAIISYDDEHALRFITAMHKIGLSAPRDFRIVGCNNTDAGRFSDPPLSSVTQDFDYIANWLIKSALALAENRSEQAKEIPPACLIVRDTCGGLGKIDDAMRKKLSGLILCTEPVSEETALN